MKLLIRLILVLLLCPNLLLGQNSIKGHIIDDSNQKPIPFSNIWILESDYGTTSMDDGSFLLLSDSNILNRLLRVSSIGYYDTLVKVTGVNMVVRLKPKVYQLSDIKIYPTKRQEFIVNDLSKVEIIGGIVNDTSPKMVGLYFPNKPEYVKYPIVKSILVFTRDEVKSKFNIRVYGFDTIAKTPTKEIIIDNLIVKSKISLIGKPKDIEIDLTDYSLQMPKSGIFIGVEWLIIPENRYKISYLNVGPNKKSWRTHYGPHLAATIDSINQSWQYYKGVWEAPRIGRYLKDNSIVKRYFNPAISIVLTD